LPFKHGNAALSAISFGDKIYSEQKLSAAYAFKKEGVQIGIRGNLLQVNAIGYGSAIAPSVDVGVITQLEKTLWLGAYASNITQSGFSTTDLIERIPSEIAIGIKYQPLEKFTLQADILKAVEQRVNFRTGIQYMLSPNLFIRTGINSASRSMHWGASLLIKKAAFHYAVSHVPNLGNTHQVSVSLRFKKPTKQVQHTNDSL
jgi:hypothetical protein